MPKKQKAVCLLLTLACASALAALLAGKVDAAGARVGVTISGGNVTASRFAELLG